MSFSFKTMFKCLLLNVFGFAFLLFFYVWCVACDLIWFGRGFRKGIGGGWVKMNQCEKDIKLHSYEERLRIFMKKSVLLEKKKPTCGKVFPCNDFFFFFCIFMFAFASFFLFYSSFKVNLKVHYRNWRIALLLMPMRVVHRPEAVCASFFEK